MQRKYLLLHLLAVVNTFDMSLTKYIIAVISTICLCSCAMDNTLQYDNITMGNFVDGEFISDQGIRYNIIELSCNQFADTLKRAMISCDILGRNEDGGYDINLTGINAIFTKEPVDSTTVSDAEMLAENPMNIGEVWYSGGYLNMLIYIPVKEGSKQAHLINLVRNDENAESGVYEFTFKHNAFGEVITSQDSDFITSSTYVSFPIAQLCKKDETQIEVILNWTSNVEKEGILSSETKRNTISLAVERTGYEHQF